MPYLFTWQSALCNLAEWRIRSKRARQCANIFPFKDQSTFSYRCIRKKTYVKKLSVFIITLFQQISKSIFTSNQYNIAFSTYQLYLILYGLLYRRFMFVWAWLFRARAWFILNCGLLFFWGWGDTDVDENISKRSMGDSRVFECSNKVHASMETNLTLNIIGIWLRM